MVGNGCGQRVMKGLREMTQNGGKKGHNWPRRYSECANETLPEKRSRMSEVVGQKR